MRGLGCQRLSGGFGGVSHADLVKPRSDLVEKQSAIRSLCETAENVRFIDYVTVDCRYSESPSLNRLRSHILHTHDKLQSVTPKVTFHAHCFHIYLVSECGSKPGIKLGDVMKTITSDPVSSKEKFLPQTWKGYVTSAQIFTRGE